MELKEVMKELESLGNDRTRKMYTNWGAKDVYGVANKDLKPIAKRLNHNMDFAMELYATGNYDAMNLAGMIVDPGQMTREIFNEWIKSADFYMISDYVVSPTLAETDFALDLAREWIDSDNEFKHSAGLFTYTWVLGVRKDNELDKADILDILNKVSGMLSNCPLVVQNAIDWFVAAVGVSYLPLHKEALEVATKINGKDKCGGTAKQQIEKAVVQNRIGFKRKSVRC